MDVPHPWAHSEAAFLGFSLIGRGTVGPRLVAVPYRFRVLTHSLNHVFMKHPWSSGSRTKLIIAHCPVEAGRTLLSPLTDEPTPARALCSWDRKFKQERFFSVVVNGHNY